MTKTRRTLSLLLYGVIGLSLAASAFAGEKKTVHFWHSMGAGNGERILALVDRFNKSQDKIEVVATFQGSYEETHAKLQAAVAGNIAPDVIQVERAYVEPYANAGRLADLNPLLAADGMSADIFVEGLMGYSYYNGDGKLYSIPFSRSTPIFYYNKDAFREVGLDPEKGPKTWDDVYEYAKKLTKTEGGATTRYGVTWPIATWYFKANVAQLGGSTINKDRTAIGFYENGVGLKVFEYWLKLRDEGLFQVTPVKDGPLIARQAFINGTAAMFQESTSLIGTLTDNCDFEIGACFLPTGGDKPAMPTGGANLAIMDSAKDMDATWAFVKWLITDPKGCLQFELDSGYMPFTKDMVKSPAIQKLWADNPMYKVAFDQLEYAVDTEQHLYWAELKTEILAAEQAVMNDNQDPKATLESLYRSSQDILSQ